VRFALGIEYDGTDFFGWQRLAHGPSVQAAVERALSSVAAHPVEVVCAGRTDAGVHARCQVVHFDSDASRSLRGWTLGLNSNLPPTIAVRWACAVADDFHARYAARARRYAYRIVNRPVRAALDARFVAWERVPLDLDAMRAASAALIGEHDFSAFRTVACQARSPSRRIHEIAIAHRGEEVTIEIEANAFLHHMVRNIVGSLLPIGRGEQRPDWLAEILAGRDRAKAGPTAPPQGLTFLGPRYPAAWNLPDEVVL
jgi:tRNA pseudouridine38-40 synthase